VKSEERKVKSDGFPVLPNIGKSTRRAIFKFCQPLAKSKENCQALAKLSAPHLPHHEQESFTRRHGATEKFGQDLQDFWRETA
jgi:hypothetical protein